MLSNSILAIAIVILMAYFLSIEYWALPVWGADFPSFSEVDMLIRLLLLTSRESACGILSCLVGCNDIATDCCRSIQDFREKLQHGSYDMVIIDELKEPIDDVEFVRSIPQKQPMATIIFIRSPGVVSAQRCFPGEDWCVLLNHPAAPAEVQREIDAIISRRESGQVIDAARPVTKRIPPFLVGEHSLMLELKELITLVSGCDLPILIRSGLGSGKEMLANAIHYLSSRSQHAFIKVPCTIYSEEALERLLFGIEQGAFNGTVQHQRSWMELADQGTIFLDRIEDTSLDVQAKLLRIIEEKGFERIGGTENLFSDVRIIASTTKDLAEEVRHDRFRSDLYSRMNILMIDIPPLRMRKSDIPILMRHFIKKHCILQHCPVLTPSESFLDVLRAYDWPGNVRELENVIERAIVMGAEDTLDVEHLPEYVRLAERVVQIPTISIDDYPSAFRVARQQFEKEYLTSALVKYGVNISHTANAIGITRRNLQIKIKQLDIEIATLKKQRRSREASA